MKNKHDNRSLPANRNYKDTIFRWLFSDKNNLLSLYNAIAGAHYQNPEALRWHINITGQKILNSR